MCKIKLLLVGASIVADPAGCRDGMRGFMSCLLQLVLVVAVLVGAAAAAAEHPEDDDWRSTPRRTLVG